VDKLETMRVFACVAREGTLANAARALGVTPTAVTRQLADLEAQLGARLVNRTTRHLALTEIGQRYLENAKQILNGVDDAEAMVREDIGHPDGRLRVQSASAFATHQLVPHLSEFRARFPNVSLDLSVTAAVTMMNENFDVCLLMLDRDLPDSSIVARELARSEIVSCASPSYLNRRGRPRHPSDLLRHDLVVPHNLKREVLFSRTRCDAMPQGETLTIKLPPAAFDSNDLELNFQAAVEGIGVAGLPSFVVAEALRTGKLERVLPEWNVQTLRLYAAVPTRHYLPVRSRAFVDFLCGCFGGTDSDPWLATMSAPPVDKRH